MPSRPDDDYETRDTFALADIYPEHKHFMLFFLNLRLLGLELCICASVSGDWVLHRTSYDADSRD